MEWVALLFFLALAKARAQCRYPCDHDRASNVGQRQKGTPTPVGREAEGASGGVACSLQPIAGMRLARSLPSVPSASTRDPLQFFKSLPSGSFRPLTYSSPANRSGGSKDLPPAAEANSLRQSNSTGGHGGFRHQLPWRRTAICRPF